MPANIGDTHTLEKSFPIICYLGDPLPANELSVILCKSTVLQKKLKRSGRESVQGDKHRYVLIAATKGSEQVQEVIIAPVLGKNNRFQIWKGKYGRAEEMQLILRHVNSEASADAWTSTRRTATRKRTNTASLRLPAADSSVRSRHSVGSQSQQDVQMSMSEDEAVIYDQRRSRTRRPSAEVRSRYFQSDQEGDEERVQNRESSLSGQPDFAGPRPSGTTTLFRKGLEPFIYNSTLDQRSTQQDRTLLPLHRSHQQAPPTYGVNSALGGTAFNSNDQNGYASRSPQREPAFVSSLHEANIVPLTQRSQTILLEKGGSTNLSARKEAGLFTQQQHTGVQTEHNNGAQETKAMHRSREGVTVRLVDDLPQALRNRIGTLDDPEVIMFDAGDMRDVQREESVFLVESDYPQVRTMTEEEESDDVSDEYKRNNTEFHFMIGDECQRVHKFSDFGTIDGDAGMLNFFVFASAGIEVPLSEPNFVLHVSINYGTRFTIVKMQDRDYQRMVEQIRTDICWKLKGEGAKCRVEVRRLGM